MAATTLNLQDQQPPAATPSGKMDNESTQNPKDVLKDDLEAQNAIKSLAKYFLGLDKWVRRQEVIDARRQRFYWRNDQYIYWKSDAVGFLPAISGQSINAGQEEVNIGRYTDVYNIYTPYGESILSTLIQNPPGVNWQAIDPSKPEDIVASKTAEKFQQKIENENDRKNLQSNVGRFYFTDGRTILYARDEDGYEKITAHGVLESKVVPITASCQKELVSIDLADELDIYQAKGLYPDYAKKMKENMATLGESAYERIARLGVLQGTRLLMQAGDAFAHMITRHTCFLRPCTFEKIDKEHRDTIKNAFPNGLKAIFCGDQYCGSEDVSMDDQISIGFPGPGDGMSRPSMGKRVIPLQDTFNDELNLWHEAHDYCIPTLFMYSETGDMEAVNEQVSQPGNIVPFTSLPPGASSAESAFYAAVLEGIPTTLPNLITFIQGPLAQFISGAFPALFGGDTGDNDTAKGIAIQRDQAMGRMGIAWSSMQQLFASAYTNAVKCAVKNADDETKFSYTVKDQTGAIVIEQFSMDDLKNGNAVCKADTDASFPESTNSKRQAYQTLMAAAERNPILASVMADPNNLEYGHTVIGLPDLKVPGAESRNKQLIEIKQLLAEPPIPPNQAEIQAAMLQDPAFATAMQQWESNKVGPSGQAVQPPLPDALYKTSIPVDPDFDNHQMEFQTVADWLSSEDARKEKESKNNLSGLLNVRLHGLQHKKLIPPPPEIPPPGAPKIGGKPGPQSAAPVLAGAPTAH